MGIPEKIAELEAEYAKTQKNKHTEAHLGLLKAKMARLRRDYEASGKSGGGGGGGFDVKKAGNSTVVFIGLPSVGKSSLLNALTGTKSKTAAYAFTTTTVIPGMLNYKGAQIQLLDLPGIIAGAAEGRGRGREVIAVARNADLVLFILDVFDPFYLPKLRETLEKIGIRLDCEPPAINIHRTEKGGIDIYFDAKQSQLNGKIVTAILNEYGIFSANVTIRENATIDQLIDVLTGNRKYAPSLAVVNKIDLVKPEFLRKINLEHIPISAEKNQNIETLKEAIFKKLRLIRVHTRSRFEAADRNAPLIVREGTTVKTAAEKLHREMKEEFKSARVWGPSAKHPGQRVGGDHALKDGDEFLVEKK
ncbi:GTP-binding protein [Candidatus Micrarchaeota archaeon]|nr:GTP-binding protein [Candidatus Micrarchaeota archaeon]